MARRHGVAVARRGVAAAGHPRRRGACHGAGVRPDRYGRGRRRGRSLNPGAASARSQAYVKLRRQGASEAGDVLLGLGTELLGFDFSETFTSGFDVGNKSVELLMLRQGIDVCCTTEADRQAIQRYERQLEEEARRQ